VSNFWIGEILRKRIGYRGIILSDDLEMGGILKFMPIGPAAVAAIRTGSDLVEICHHAEPILLAYEALVTEAEKSGAFRKILLERARRTTKLKAKIFKKEMPAALSEKQFEALRERILAFGDKIERIAPAVAVTSPAKPPSLVETA
jgi:beta-N-acetylhexosaminidase